MQPIVSALVILVLLPIVGLALLGWVCDWRRDYMAPYAVGIVIADAIGWVRFCRRPRPISS